MSLVNLSFIKYNNYFNKILKKPQNPYIMSQYEEYEEKLYLTDVAFNPNDGVTAYHVIPKDIDEIGDYLLVSDSSDIVLSHWFVIEAKRYRVGQCMVTLQRDLLVDYYSNIRTAPAFIERGMLSNDDPMIFNDEGLQYNQIKTEVKPLWDNTECGWIVGYLAKESDLDDENVEANVTIDSATADYTYSSWNDAPEILRDLVTGAKKYRTEVQYELQIKNPGYVRVEDKTHSYYMDYIKTSFNGVGYRYNNKNASDFILRSDGTVATARSTKHLLRTFNFRKDDSNPAYASEVIDRMNDYLLWSIKQTQSSVDSIYDLKNQDYKETIDAFSDKIVEVGGTKYKIKTNTYSETITDILSDHPSLDSLVRTKIMERDALYYFRTIFVNSLGVIQNNVDLANLEFEFNCQTTVLEASELGQVAKMVMPNHANRQETIDAQYDIFAIPYPLNNFGKDGTAKFATSPLGIQTITVSSEVSLAMAQRLAVLFGSKLYDIQLLPYCPVNLPNNGRAHAPVKPFSDEIGCKDITVNDVIKSFVIFASHSQIDGVVYNNWIDKSSDSKTQKILYKYRLSGGNYASMFDFTPDMNGGVDYFVYYCNFKPFKPFIKVNPYFNYLYGREEFKDANGLILSGDFSISRVSEAWTEFMNQNKNFEAMFDRNIMSIERANEVSKLSSIFGAVAGTVGGAVAGGMAGSKAGPYGAVAGAVVGGTAAGVGGAIDVNNQEMLRQDSLSSQYDMHAFQIDNIKALPNTIQKVTTLTVIDKVVPVLEIYECTETEKKAFSDYIKFNGMTVGRIDQIANFEEEGGFIQGRFLRLEGLTEDYHLANAINTTFQAGFYFDKEEE